MSYYINPKRLKTKNTFLGKIKFALKRFISAPILSLGFKNIEYYYVHGEGNGNKLFLGKNVSTADAVFNISSGNITVNDNTIFAHDVHVLTGFHRFFNGKLAKLQEGSPREVPLNGFDITIGSGCFIGSRVTILKGVTIGDNVIIGAGSVVTKDLPANVFAAGVPVKIISKNI
jgi:acetyltransferase-like isoleucine patch superfamily enzyme